MQSQTESPTLISSMMRAARLDASFFNEVEQDTTRNGQALTVVIIAAAAGGIGGLLGGIVRGSLTSALMGLVVAVVMGIVGYYIWAYVTHFVGTRFFGGTADTGEMLRTLGFAYAPNVLGIFSFIPCVGPLIALVGAIWSLVAGIIAVREALDFDTGKAVLTAIIGWLIILVVTFVLTAILGVGAVGLNALTGGLGG